MLPVSPDLTEPPALDFLALQDPANMRAFAQEADGLLQLRFDMACVQSAMRLADPIALELEYTRMMMRCLLFNPDPRSMLMLGLGGGSLAKYCYHHFPQAQITAVEINPHVIALRGRFKLPPDGPRLRVLQADGAAYVLAAAKEAASPAKPGHDAILVDAYHFDGAPQGINSRAFFRACRDLLSPRGVMVVNLESEPAQSQPVLEKISQAFDGAVWSVPVDSTNNRIAFAASKNHLMTTMRQADARLAALAPVHQETLTQRVGKRLAFAPLFG
jgi:spermidine synthase